MALPSKVHVASRAPGHSMQRTQSQRGLGRRELLSSALLALLLVAHGVQGQTWGAAPTTAAGKSSSSSSSSSSRKYGSKSPPPPPPKQLPSSVFERPDNGNQLPSDPFIPVPAPPPPPPRNGSNSSLAALAALGAIPFIVAAALPGAEGWINGINNATAAADAKRYTPVEAQQTFQTWFNLGKTAGDLLTPARPVEKDLYPMPIPTKEQLASCAQNASDPMSMAIHKCEWFNKQVSCQQLAAKGFLPPGVQSFTPGKLTGKFTLPYGCGSGNLGLLYDGVKLLFNSPSIPIMAVISKDLVWKVAYYGTGSTQGRLIAPLTKAVELCYVPTSVAPLYVTKTATFSHITSPGDASWSLAKSVSLPPPYLGGNVAALLRGDSANATWRLSAVKSGTDLRFQASVTGQIALTNAQPVTTTVYSLVDGVTNGPGSTVTCSAPMPFRMPACSTVICNYVSLFPTQPANGTYQSLAVATYQVDGTAGVGSAQGVGAFIAAPPTVVAGSLQTTNGPIPAGNAMITDALGPPPRTWIFQGTAAVEYGTQLQCPADPAMLVNTAYLTAATGQQVMSTATLQAQCVDLAVRVNPGSITAVSAWQWTVNKTVNQSSLRLRPVRTSYDDYIARQVELAVLSGQSRVRAEADLRAAMPMAVDTRVPTAGNVTYTVTYTRSLPASAAAGAAPWEVTGTVVVTNPSTAPARLQSVRVTIQHPQGRAPAIANATCPRLVVNAGQRLTCSWRATPSFNPAGQPVAAVARYRNMVNGRDSRSTTDFFSPSVLLTGTVTVKQSNTKRALLQSDTLEVPEPIQALANLLGKEITITKSSGSTAVGATSDGGTTVAAAAAAPQGLADECVTVNDVTSGLTGRVVAGRRPSGRICKDRTFTYTVRYDNFTTCFSGQRVVNTASYVGSTTGTTGRDAATVSVSVAGCTAPLTARISRVKVTANAAYAWSVKKVADPPSLVLVSGIPSTVQYTVSYARRLLASDSAVNGSIMLTNMGLSPVDITSANVTTTTTCSGKPSSRTAPVPSCVGRTVAAGRSTTCSFSAPVTCVARGLVTVSVAGTSGDVTTSNSLEYNFGQLKPLGSTTCANVSDTWKKGQGLVSGGRLVEGSRPSGQVCDDKTFAYSVRLGPFTSCGSYRAINTASFRTSGGPTPSGSTDNTMVIDVSGCGGRSTLQVPSPPSPAPSPPPRPTPAPVRFQSVPPTSGSGSSSSAGGCVRPLWFWQACMAGASSAADCNAVSRLPSGAKTSFFAKANTKAPRDYAAVMAAEPHAGDMLQSTWVNAGQAFIAAQMNYLNGAPPMAPQVSRALKVVTDYLSVNDATTPVSSSVMQSVAAAAVVVRGYSGGTQGAVSC